MANLYYGSSGDEVKTLQQNLNTVGNYGLDVDGAYGPKTQAAVTDFQTKSNIAVDGVVGDQTRGALNDALAKLNTTTAAAQQEAAAQAQQNAQDTSAANATPSQLAQSIGNIKTSAPEIPATPDFRPELDAWLAAAQEQQTRQVDYATEKGVRELQRAEEDARPQYQQLRNQISADEAKALDNQALYAEARGDRGGVGQAQYGAIQNTAAQNRLQVNEAQTKLATDTARGIADLRAQGEFEKADALLQLTQTYLSQLMNLEQWAAEYNFSAAQFRQSVAQWQAEFEMQAATVLESQRQWELTFQQNRENAETQTLASAGGALLSAGILPSDSQLKAMGMTKQQAQDYIAAQNLATAAKTTTRTGGTTVKTYSTGGLTASEIKALQSALGVSVDGVVGPETYGAYTGLGYTSISDAYDDLVGGSQGNGSTKTTYSASVGASLRKGARWSYSQVQNTLKTMVKSGATKADIASALTEARRHLSEAEYAKLTKEFG